MMIAYYIAVALMLFVLMLCGYYRYWGIAMVFFIAILATTAYIDMVLMGQSQDIYYSKQLHPAKQYQVVYGNIIEGKEIFLLLNMGGKQEPLYISLPYSEKRADQMKKAAERANATAQPLMFDLKMATEGVPANGKGTGTPTNQNAHGQGGGNNIDSNQNALYKDADPFFTPPPPKAPDKQIPSYVVTPPGEGDATIYQHNGDQD